MMVHKENRSLSAQGTERVHIRGIPHPWSAGGTVLLRQRCPGLVEGFGSQMALCCIVQGFHWRLSHHSGHIYLLKCMQYREGKVIGPLLHSCNNIMSLNVFTLHSTRPIPIRFLFLACLL